MFVIIAPLSYFTLRKKREEKEEKEEKQNSQDCKVKERLTMAKTVIMVTPVKVKAQDRRDTTVDSIAIKQ